MKRRLKKKAILFLMLIVVIIIFLVIVFLHFNSAEYKLKQIGYNNNEIKCITNKLESKEINKLLENKYFKDLTPLINDKRYEKKNFNKYLKLLKEGEKIEDIFKTETPPAVSDNISSNEEETVNQDNIKIEDNSKINNKENDKNKFKNSTYYIDSNIERYLNYLNANPTKDTDEIVRCVNANIDYEFYTNVSATNLNDGYLILVNKYTKLDETYKPNLIVMEDNYSYSNMQMESIAYENFKQMVDNAKNDGIKLYNVSSYRSYSTQNYLYNNYVNSSGKQAADTFSARAGYSEHQTGLASDINTASSSEHFENTKEYEWLINNSYKYGFIIRYPLGKEYITGYKFEPWHYRYVGKDAAKYIKEHNITFEEYYAYFVKNK